MKSLEESVAITPLLDQYFALKKEAADAILLFRVGDFYEAYGEDAGRLSQALEIVLTAREVRGMRVPMAGVPHHTLENQVKELLFKGHNVAISEQLEEASEAKGLIRREIVRFLTPGTVLEEGFLNEKEPNYLLAIYPEEKQYGLSWCDVSTGAWFALAIPAEKDLLRHEVSKIAPKEILLFTEALRECLPLHKETKISSFINFEEALALPSTLPREAEKACRLLYGYLRKVYCGQPPRLLPPLLFQDHRYLILDSPTIRNLELLRNLASGGREGSLLFLLDQTKTPMGGRLLRQWLLHPLLDTGEIEKRQKAIAELLENSKILENLQRSLTGMGDLERLLGRVSFRTAHARDLLAIRNILVELPNLASQISLLKSEIFREFSSRLPDFSDLRNLLLAGLESNPPLSLKEGGLIRGGFHEELDLLRKGLKEALSWIADLEERERKATGVRSLKVGFNQVFGYYIEVTRPNLSLVPSHYIRKQTLANAERYVIEELKVQEVRILGGQEKSKNLEYEIFCGLREECQKQNEKLQCCASLLATLDVLLSLAGVAARQNYSCPLVEEGETLAVKGGRHPVVEANGLFPFVPNDTALDSEENSLILLTGPNMAGKSTYLRQVALIVILAQMGSFVPAEAAKIGVVDRVFTRIGALDDLHRGESTFFVEMKETAEILKKSTCKSLVLLDEVGRGTSTFDGLSIAWAVAEELLRKKAKVLFATHYHEMTFLPDHFAGVKNFTMMVKEQGEEVIFLRRVIPGKADKSYGIHVARLAGVPDAVLKKSKEVLKELEQKKVGKRIKGENGSQLAFDTNSPSPLPDLKESAEKFQMFKKALSNMDLNRLTGLEALNFLAQWKSSACDG